MTRFPVFAAAMAIVAAVTPTLALFSGVSVTPMFILFSVGAIAATWTRQPWNGLSRPPLIFLAVAVAWGLISCFWTVTSVDHAVLSICSTTSVAVTGLIAVRASFLLSPRQRCVVRQGLLAGVGSAVAVLLFEVAFGYPLTGLIHNSGADGAGSIISRGTVLLVLLLWPTSVILPRFRAGILVLAVSVAVVGTGKHAATLALVMAAAAFLAIRGAPASTLWLGRILAVALILSAPLAGWVLPSAEDAGRAGLFNSALHRVVIWHFTTDRIVENPWRGWGMDASRSLAGADDETVVSLVHRHGSPELRHYPNLPLHPHNGALQVWLELGLPGALLLAGLLWWAIGLVRDSPPAHRSARAAALFAAFAVGCLSYGIWQSWWQSSLWLIGALFAVVTPAEDAPCAA